MSKIHVGYMSRSTERLVPPLTPSGTAEQIREREGGDREQTKPDCCTGANFSLPLLPMCHTPFKFYSVHPKTAVIVLTLSLDCNDIHIPRLRELGAG